MKGKGSRGVHTTALVMVLVSAVLLPDAFGQTYSGPKTVRGYVLFHRGGYAMVYPASYTLTNGLLTPQSLWVELATFDQLGGTNRVAENLQIQQGWFNDQSVYRLSGGRLVTSNTLTHTYSGYVPGIRGFQQNGGTHVIRGTLSLQSSYGAFPGGYTLSGGALIANNVEVGGSAIFWQGGGRLTNNGTITLAGGHWKRGPLAQRTQRFGRLQLQAETNSNFTFSTGALATVRFAPSAAMPWDPQARLVFHGWQGLTSGTGGLHQIYFGTNRSGLTPQQLSQIRFRDPKGFAPGDYPARQRGTGEIVPNARPVISVARDGQDILVQWPAGYVLQTATNVLGPFFDVEATSPYRKPTASEPQRYFRLRR